MARAAILEKFARAVAQGEQDRLGVSRGLVDAADVVLRRRRDLRVAAGLYQIPRKHRRDPSYLSFIWADLVDDGLPDWTYWLDNPGRRYRLRPWRAEDGAPWSYYLPCITVLDGEGNKRMFGIPAGALTLRGEQIKLVDTDACCAALFACSRPRRARA